MPAWLWIAVLWVAASLVIALGFSRWMRWARGDFDRIDRE